MNNEDQNNLKKQSNYQTPSKLPNDMLELVSGHKNINTNIVSDKKDIVVEYSSFLKRVSITSKINKETAANKLIDFNDWNYSDIYSVGDGKNDLELLTAYNGYKMLLSDPRLYYYIDDTTTSLHKLIKKIN